MQSRLVVAFALLSLACGSSVQAQAPADTIAQRVLACTACHEPSGRRGPDAYYPRIAGKPAGYLYNQLVNFREGRRFYALMTYLVDHLPDAYLREIAAHFASLEVPPPSIQPPNVPPRLFERGRVLAKDGDANRELPACAECHGVSLTGLAPAIPGLLGLPRDYLSAQFGAWQAGLRRADAPDCMAEIAQRMSPDDVAAVTAWLAAQPMPPAGARASTAATRLPMKCGSVDAARAASAR